MASAQTSAVATDQGGTQHTYLRRYPQDPIMMPIIPSDSWNGLAYGDPVHLTASSPVDPQSDATPNTDALIAPDNMLIHEIKFGLQVNTGKSTNAAIGGGTFGCSLSLGGQQLTNGSVPLWLFAPTYWQNNPFSGSQSAGLIGCEDAAGDVTTFDESWELSVPLRTPLYLRAGEYIRAEIRNLGGLASSFPNAPTAYVSYSGCKVSGQEPAKRTLPWWAFWMSKEYDPTSTTAASEASTESDLVNATDFDVRLSWLIGQARCLSIPDNYEYPDAVPVFGSQLAQIQMAGANGEPIVADLVGFRSLFSAITRAWPLDNAVLQARQWLKAYLNVQAASAGGTANQWNCSTHIGIVGEFDAPLAGASA